jgi:ribosome-associated protein
VTSHVEIDERLAIPLRELTFSVSRRGGPGGQHANKVATRVTLEFRPLDSPSLDDAQRRRIAARLASRLTQDGRLRLHSARHRSQHANREEVLRRFCSLLRTALRARRVRKPTRPSRAAVERRLELKRARARRKRERSTTD